jgi:hypothetical protein
LVEVVVVLECLMLVVIIVVDVEEVLYLEAVVVGTGAEVVVEVEALLVI